MILVIATFAVALVTVPLLAVLAMRDLGMGQRS